MARLKTVNEAPSLSYYRSWSTARDESKEKSSELGEVVKEAVEELGVDKKAFKLACQLKRADPVKASAFLRGFNQLVTEFGIDAQTDIEDAIAATESAA